MNKEINVLEMKKIDEDKVVKLFPDAHILNTSPKGPSDDEWLSGLKIGTIFLAKPKPEAPVSKIFLQQYTIEHKYETSVKLLSDINEPEQFCVVDPVEFCRFFALHEIIHSPEESEE